MVSGLGLASYGKRVGALSHGGGPGRGPGD